MSRFVAGDRVFGQVGRRDINCSKKTSRDAAGANGELRRDRSQLLQCWSYETTGTLQLHRKDRGRLIEAGAEARITPDGCVRLLACDAEDSVLFFSAVIIPHQPEVLPATNLARGHWPHETLHS